jgi:hypothetical protein
VKVLSAVSFGNLVFSTFRVTDGDDTITDLEVRLYKDGALVQTIDNVTLTPQVANPGTFNATVNLIYSGIGDYLIVVVYTYDLNDDYLATTFKHVAMVFENLGSNTIRTTFYINGVQSGVNTLENFTPVYTSTNGLTIAPTP